MPPPRPRIDFPNAVKKRGYTTIPNALDDFGLDPYQYRVLVFIIRWKGKATVEKPFIALSLKYLAEKTCISISKVKECIHDLEHNFHFIVVHRRKRLRNLYDIRPLFTVLLKMQAGAKKTNPDSLPEGAADEDEQDATEAGLARDRDVRRSQSRLQQEAEGPPVEDPADEDANEDEEGWYSDDKGEDHQVRSARFGTPSYTPDPTLHPGMDDDEDDPFNRKRRQRLTVSEAPAQKLVLSEQARQELVMLAKLELPGCFTKMYSVGRRPWNYQWANEFADWVSPDQVNEVLQDLQEQPKPVTARDLAFAVFKKYAKKWAQEHAAKRRVEDEAAAAATVQPARFLRR